MEHTVHRGDDQDGVLLEKLVYMTCVQPSSPGLERRLAGWRGVDKSLGTGLGRRYRGQ